MPATGFLANVAVVAQFAPLDGRSAGQSDAPQPELVQLQIFESEQLQVLHASAAKSSVAHGD
ncbi:MAG TPA: hypothetical protein VER04_03145 [Polyangiaceae bacterium]|nr:hypothetical protein [Polyangiaceae bacterium]